MLRESHVSTAAQTYHIGQGQTNSKYHKSVRLSIGGDLQIASIDPHSHSVMNDTLSLFY